VFSVAVAGVAVAAVAAVLALVHTLNGQQLPYYLGGWPPPLGIEYLVDRVAAFASTTLLGVALVVLIATRRMALVEFGDRLGFFYGLILLMLAGIAGMIVTHDLFNLFVFAEVGSLAAYALVFRGGPRGMIAAFRYLILGSIGGGFPFLPVLIGIFAFAQIMTDLEKLNEPRGRAVRIHRQCPASGDQQIQLHGTPFHPWHGKRYITVYQPY
jgi:multicomponent Na+:H+ antiporter subunit D